MPTAARIAVVATSSDWRLQMLVRMTDDERADYSERAILEWARQSQVEAMTDMLRLMRVSLRRGMR